MKVTVIIPAGGAGKRFGGEYPKQFAELNGIPTLIRTISIFEKMDEIDSIIIPLQSDWFTKTKDLLKAYGINKVKEMVIGGKEKQDSVMNALHTKTCDEADIILVHDAVRPLTKPALIKEIISVAEENGAVIPGIRIKDPVKMIRKNMIEKTVDENRAVMVQTPQGYWQELIKNAYDSAAKAGFNGADSSALIEFIGYKVTVIDGDQTNIKINTPFDLAIAETILKGQF